MRISEDPDPYGTSWHQILENYFSSYA
uniref:Uncharacterized protein n=1 Tax=Arundo donax TaxID=35708 RepID=A0A0A8ZFT2_ARUDO